jgi:uncharacterized membrane protein YccC
LEVLPIDFDGSADASLSERERWTATDFAVSLRSLDQTSRNLLQIMRVLAGMEPLQTIEVPRRVEQLRRLSRWDGQRLMHALYPPIVFIAAYVFWILMAPPTGAKVPMFAGIIALVILRTPMNPVGLLVVLVLSIFLLIAPIYWLVMPALSTGIELLGLIFIYSFVFGYLGGRSPALKSGPIIMFAVMTGISNQQSYSFQGPVDGALMIVMAGSILTIIYVVVTPIRPEKAALYS